MTGTFIALEGINGSGKTTQAEKLAQLLKAQGYPVTLVREPGSTHVGESIREIVKSTGQDEATPMTQLLLYNAARAQMLHEVTVPALQAGHIVISDRYTASTVAYQGHGQGIDPDLVRTITTLAVGTTLPDLVLLLDLPVETALTRTQDRGVPDPKLTLGEEFQNRVRQGFIEEMRQARQGTWVRIDASQHIETVATLISRAVTDQIPPPPRPEESP